MVAKAQYIAEKLETQNINAEIINARFLKPLDENKIKESIQKTKRVITIEDGTKINGLGTAIEELIVKNNIENVKLDIFAYPDEFITHGSVDELEKIYGLNNDDILSKIIKGDKKQNG